MYMISNQTLMKIASLGGFITASTGYAFYYRIQYDIKKSETYKDVMNTLQTHKKAVPYLGEPITLGRIIYGDGHRTLKHKEMKVMQNYKWFEVPLTGTNTKAKLYYEVTLSHNLKNKPEVSKIEITFDNIPGKTFVIRQCEIH
ncbi:uncharacterized protein LOC105839993 isoform X2 [Monomorium pharaonis]|uniref:uncharacterized protein LOC105839993 isoform X2 n=1 Tax=Monomorium pharaonis TaxID=307658 RepID=UPI00063F1FA3|nr:uncharacterized protein LOC105839993 isoform X2 [Monomorium pharaonis]